MRAKTKVDIASAERGDRPAPSCVDQPEDCLAQGACIPIQNTKFVM